MSGNGAAQSGPVAVAPVPRAPAHPETVELRLALVCYGGVSLAIYMHGVTKEIQKLVAASKAYEENPDENPFEESDTEHAYWQALRRREDDKGLRTRVVVDVISGTSAGGINGIILAKALARDLPQDGLREVWLDKGDIKKLMAIGLPTLPLKLLGWGARSLVRKPKPPLDGKRMFKWILEALRSMDKDPPGGSLMPPAHPLELFVTVTDFHGYNRRVPTYDPKRVSDLRHRHVMVFAHAPGRDQLDQGHNEALAFAARATSSFPGAFPPINIANVEENVPGWDGLDDFLAEFWSIYPLSGADVLDTHFVDGGVLDNFPFRHSIDAIRRRPAALEVDRRLVYIEPDPKGLSEPPAPDPPAWGETIWGGLAGIRGHEPVLDDLLAVRELNERIDRIREIVEAGIGTVSAPGVAEPGESFDEAAVNNSSFAYTTYIQLKLHSVVARLARRVCDVSGFPPDSNHAFFVNDVLVQWARDNGVIAPSVEPTATQREFLQRFDLEYADRRIRFAISYLNGLYGPEGGSPSRAELNEAKRRLYRHIARLGEVSVEAGAGPPGDAVRALFDAQLLTGSIDNEDPPDASVAAFLDEHGEALDSVHDVLGEFLDEQLSTFGDDVSATVIEMSEPWDEPAQRGVRDRYLRFPLWDVLIFPLQAVADVGELNRVEVVRFSPEDVGILQVEGQQGDRPTAKEKLKGVPLGHFAAFFGRDRRENDYLWGRLDAAERLVTLVLGETDREISKGAFRAILDQEERDLGAIPGVFAHLRPQLAQEAAGAT